MIMIIITMIMIIIIIIIMIIIMIIIIIIIIIMIIIIINIYIAQIPCEYDQMHVTNELLVSHDVTEFQTLELLILLRFYFHYV